jgi:hypothetical protein
MTSMSFRMSRARRPLSIASAVALVSALPVLVAAEEPTEDPFLWMIETNPPSFLYGTIHVPDERVLDLPDVVAEALDAADAVYTEIPMDTATQMAAASAFMLPSGTTLKDRLPDDVYRQTEAYLADKGLSILFFQQMKPYALATQIMMLDYMDELMAGAQPLDAALASQATAASKDVRALETVDEQIQVFESLTDEEEVELLRVTLEHMSTSDGGASAMDALVDAYLAGDEDTLVQVAFEYFEEDDPLTEKFMQVAVDDRNVRMTDRIVESLHEEPGRVHFFAIGALHYPMDMGILALLDEKGYEVTRVTADDAERLTERLAATR